MDLSFLLLSVSFYSPTFFDVMGLPFGLSGSGPINYNIEAARPYITPGVNAHVAHVTWSIIGCNLKKHDLVHRLFLVQSKEYYLMLHDFFSSIKIG
jgi:hypothetical protein